MDVKRVGSRFVLIETINTHLQGTLVPEKQQPAWINNKKEELGLYALVIAPLSSLCDWRGGWGVWFAMNGGGETSPSIESP
jgi:hypothetical protein